MTKPFRVFKADATVVRIYPDPDPISPEEIIFVGRLWIFHRRYCFGHEPEVNFHDFASWEEMEQHIRKELDAAAILPVYGYDHGGLCLSTTPFDCPWDSGQLGFIWISKAEAREWYGRKLITKHFIKTLKEDLEETVARWHEYISGDVYYYEVEKNEEVTETCGSFYGSRPQDIQAMLNDALGTENAKKAVELSC